MWVPLGCALGLFIYQTLDAIDGKQARRTGSSNALGELFDHGCDSMSTIFVTLAGACAMGMGHIQVCNFIHGAREENLHNYFNLHVCPSIRRRRRRRWHRRPTFEFSIPDIVSHSVTNKSSLICVKSEKCI